jgi:glycosyltransferase involved in cell wall biosynthesis
VSERPHVMRVLTRLNIGGPARQELLAARALEPWYRSTVVAGHAPEVEGELSDPAVPVKRTSLVRPVAPMADVRAYIELRSIMRADRPALVHTHMAKGGALGRLAAASLRPRPKIVHTYHGHVLEGYFSAPVQRVFIQAERRLARISDALIVVSDEIREELLALRIGLPHQYRVVPLGLDLAAHLKAKPPGTLRTQLGLGPSVPLVGIIGRLVPIKDHETLLQAMSRVPGTHLAVLGDGELREELEQRTAELRLSDRVHFVGWWLDMPEALVDLDLAVLSSRNEGTPVALIEAAACGRAVVATDVGGVRAVVNDEMTGLLVPPGDPEALAVAINALLTDPAQRRHMEERARTGVDRYSADRLVADLRAIYDPLLGRPS